MAAISLREMWPIVAISLREMWPIVAISLREMWLRLAERDGYYLPANLGGV